MADIAVSGANLQFVQYRFNFAEAHDFLAEVACLVADNVFSEDLIDQMVLVKRAGRPDEVAALVNFLASDQAGYISGQVISINGGVA